LRTFARLCAALTEIGIDTFCAPALNAASAPFAFGAKATVSNPSMVRA
jgi:hypothetical protein